MGLLMVFFSKRKGTGYDMGICRRDGAWLDYACRCDLLSFCEVNRGV